MTFQIDKEVSKSTNQFLMNIFNHNNKNRNNEMNSDYIYVLIKDHHR